MTDQLKRAPLAARLLVAAACVYEIVALFTRLPTITALTHRAKRHPGLRIAVWTAAGAAVWHFFVEAVEDELS